MRLQEILRRMAEIKAELENEGADINALDTEFRGLLAEKVQIEKRENLLKDVGNFGTPVPGIIPTEERKAENMTREEIVASPEYRTAFYKQLQNKTLTDAEQRALSSASGSAGAAIPTQTADLIVKKMYETAPMLSEITLLRVAGNITIATGLNSDKAYQHGENAAITESTDTLAYVTLAGFEMAKLITISKTVQTMAINAMEQWLVDTIFNGVALKIENAIIYGTGTNEPGGLGSILMTAGTNLISTTAALSYDNVCTLMTYPQKGLRKGAKFLCNSSFPYTQLAGIKDSSNRPIFVESMKDGVPGTLMGKPVLISDEVNDNELYYGNYKYIYGNLASDIVVESSTQSGFRNGSIDYRGCAIFDCDVAAPLAFAKFKKN